MKRHLLPSGLLIGLVFFAGCGTHAYKPAFSALADEHAVCQGRSTGDYPSPCGKWNAYCDGQAVIVSANPDHDDCLCGGGAHEASGRGGTYNFSRRVGIFWMPSPQGSLLVINDYECSHCQRARILNPRTGQILDIDQYAWNIFEDDYRGAHAYDHNYAIALSFSPDGKEILLHLCGHTSYSEGDRFYVVDSLTGRVLHSYWSSQKVPRLWHQRQSKDWM